MKQRKLLISGASCDMMLLDGDKILIKIKFKVGDIVLYNGKLVEYHGLRGVITTSYKSGLCKGRFQVFFEKMEVYDNSLTCSPDDLELLNR